MGRRRRRGYEFLFLAVTIVLVAAGALALFLTRATTLTVAVAPSGGTEPVLLRAYAEALKHQRTGVHLKILAFDGVKESAQALQDGRADLAVVRPDILMPGNGLTLAILREQALLVAVPEPSPVKAITDLGRRRLGILAARISDGALIRAVLEQAGLVPGEAAPAVADAARAVTLVPIEESEIAAAIAGKRIDALVLLTTPTTPAASRILGLVRGAARNRKMRLLGVEDGDGFTLRHPQYQTVTVAEGLFGGQPKLPEDDLATVGTSYRLVARESLSRPLAAEVTQHLFELRSRLAETTPAANAVAAPSYDSTAAATSARLPIHLGAIDYFEREQQSVIERYETWIYLVAFLGGGLGSTFAWLRQRWRRLRRERVEVATRRLLHIRTAARRTTERDALDAMAAEIDDLAGNIARYALNRPTEALTMMAATIAIDAARSTVRRARAGEAATPNSRLRAAE
ncbi:TAXI family TRAP transporter solute-binding subunit [Methylobacterium sp. JK268]